MHIASNDPDENPFNIALTGTGVMAPAVVTTLAATTAVTATSVTLNGTVNANEQCESAVSFDYGADASATAQMWPLRPSPR